MKTIQLITGHQVSARCSCNSDWPDNISDVFMFSDLYPAKCRDCGYYHWLLPHDVRQQLPTLQEAIDQHLTSSDHQHSVKMYLLRYLN